MRRKSLLSSALARSTSARTSATGCTSTRLKSVTHHASACKGHNQHEEPVGDEAKRPHDVTVGDGQTQLSDLAVEGVEPRIEEHKAGLLLVGSPELDEVIGRGGRKVQSLLVDVHGRGGRKHVEGPDGSGAGGPRITQDRLVVAVEHAHVRRAREDGELGGRFVEGLLNVAAVAYHMLARIQNTCSHVCEVAISPTQ